MMPTALSSINQPSSSQKAVDLPSSSSALAQHLTSVVNEKGNSAFTQLAEPLIVNIASYLPLESYKHLRETCKTLGNIIPSFKKMSLALRKQECSRDLKKEYQKRVTQQIISKLKPQEKQALSEIFIFDESLITPKSPSGARYGNSKITVLIPYPINKTHSTLNIKGICEDFYGGLENLDLVFDKLMIGEQPWRKHPSPQGFLHYPMHLEHILTPSQINDFFSLANQVIEKYPGPERLFLASMVAGIKECGCKNPEAKATKAEINQIAEHYPALFSIGHVVRHHFPQ